MMQQTTLRSATYSMELSQKGLSSMLGLMNRHRASRIGQLLLKVGGAALGLMFALIATWIKSIPWLPVRTDSLLTRDHLLDVKAVKPVTVRVCCILRPRATALSA